MNIITNCQMNKNFSLYLSTKMYKYKNENYKHIVARLTQVAHRYFEGNSCFRIEYFLLFCLGLVLNITVYQFHYIIDEKPEQCKIGSIRVDYAMVGHSLDTYSLMFWFVLRNITDSLNAFKSSKM